MNAIVKIILFLAGIWLFVLGVENLKPPASGGDVFGGIIFFFLAFFFFYLALVGPHGMYRSTPFDKVESFLGPGGYPSKAFGISPQQPYVLGGY